MRQAKLKKTTLPKKLKDLEQEYDNWYRKFPKKWVIPRRDMFIVESLRPYGPFHSILDVGCGNGHTLVVLREAYPEANLYGLDLSSVGLKQAKQKVPSLHTVHNSLERFKPDEPIDLIVNLGTMEHVEKIEEGLQHLIKLNPKYCYFEAPNNLAYSPGEEGYKRLSCGSRQIEWHLTRNSWEKLFKKAGLIIEKSLKGDRPPWEFVWILRCGNQSM